MCRQPVRSLCQRNEPSSSHDRLAEGFDPGLRRLAEQRVASRRPASTRDEIEPGLLAVLHLIRERLPVAAPGDVDDQELAAA